MILETILTTQDAAGAVNCAPMGVEWGDEEIVIKPFLETTTFEICAIPARGRESHRRCDAVRSGSHL